MEITTEQYERIIHFLDAEMTLAEMEAFEKELVSNSEMRRQLDFEQTLRNDFALQNITSLPVAGAESGEENTRGIPVKTTSIRKWLAISAAAAAIVIVTFFVFFRQTHQPTTEVANTTDVEEQPNNLPKATDTARIKNDAAIDLASLFKQYFIKDAIPEGYPLYLAEALTDYESGKYATLQKLNLHNLPETRGTDEADNKKKILQLGHYYKGLAFLQTNNINEAKTNLDWVLRNNPPKALRAKTQWYLALVYLKENNGEKAAELCRNIVANKENKALIKNAEKILDIVER